jgi:thioredoxin-related protein
MLLRAPIFMRSLALAGLMVLTLPFDAMAQSQPVMVAELVMVEEDGCMWCARWNTEISAIYPKTAVGKAAPLRRMDIRAQHPDDLEFSGALRFTPTFVLMVGGKEVSRIEGYPGEDFFWGLLEQMIKRAYLETLN